MRKYKREGVILNKPLPKKYLKEGKKKKRKKTGGRKKQSEVRQDEHAVKGDTQEVFYPFEPYLEQFENEEMGLNFTCRKEESIKQ